MAERTMKRMECDKRQCRNRKGVIRYRILIIANPQPHAQLSNEEDVCMDEAGEQCPRHIALLIEKIRLSFHNTKVYEAPVEKEENDGVRTDNTG